MNHKEITQTNIDNNFKIIIDCIIKKAQVLSVNTTIIIRRELVDYINSTLNIHIKESAYIKQLIKTAYEKTAYSKSIQEALVNNILENDGKNSVYNPDRVDDNTFSLDIENPNINMNNFTLITLQNEKIKDIDGVKLIDDVVREIDLIEREKTISITGSSKVESYREHAFNIKNNYEKLIQTYEYVKNINLDLISDFEVTRNRLKIIREDLLNLLIDLFGDSIKTTEPDMFNFSEINWNNYEDSYPKLELFYNGINNEIEIFKEFHSEQMRAISVAGKDGFKSFLNSADKISKTNGRLTKSDVKGAAAFAAGKFMLEAGQAIFKSRSQSKKTIAQIELDIEKLKQGMQSDVEKIMNDILKLGELQTEIKNKLIPQLELFTNRVSEIVINKISPYYKKIIKNKELKELRNNNLNLTIEKRKIKEEFIDKHKQVKYHEYMFTELSTLVKNQVYEYNYVNSLFPEEPNWFYKIVSPTNSKKLYNQTLEDWNIYCKPFIENHIFLKESIKTEVQLKNTANEDLQKLAERENFITIELKQNSEKINTIFKSSNESKEELKNLLEAVKEVSVSSKSVLEINISKDII